MFKQKHLTKLGNIIIAKMNGSKTYRLVLETKEYASELYDKLSNLDPEEDFDYFIEVCETVLAGDEVQEIIRDKEKQESKIRELESISEIHPDLIFKNNKVYHKTIQQLSLPERLVEEFFVRHDLKEDLNPLINFWMWCACNPDPKAREGLFRFIMDMNLALTPEGMFVAYRNVVDISGVNVELVKKVSDALITCAEKRWSTKTRNLLKISYVIFDKIEDESVQDEDFDDEYSEYDDYNDSRIYESSYFVIKSGASVKEMNEIVSKQVFKEKGITHSDLKLNETVLEITDYQDLGCISDLARELGQLQEDAGIYFTDAHTRSMKIQLGVPVQMPRSECDEDENVSCSRGLHLGSESFMSRNSFGDTPLICLVNPRNVVAVPLDYGNSYKMRCCEYLPIGFAEYDESGSLIPLKSKTLHTVSKDYVLSDIEDLKSLLSTFDFKELVEHQIVPKNVGIVNIGAALNRIKKEVEARVEVI
jgi:hypothetical protein